MSFLIGAIKPHSGVSERLRSSRDLGWNGLVAERWRHEPCEIEPCTPQSALIVLNLSGRMRVRRKAEGVVETHDATEGTIWLMPAGAPSRGVELSDGRFDSLIIALPQRAMSQAADELLSAPVDAITVRQMGGFKDPVIESIGRSLARELDEPHPLGRLYAETAAATLEAYLLRRFSNRSDDAQPAPPRGALNASRLRKTLDLINERIGDDLSLKELALETSLSVFHFARAFKAATGVAPHQYVLERRVARARDLLAQGELSLSEIAQACGFASQAHLTNVFKRAVGVTPGVYRSQALRR